MKDREQIVFEEQEQMLDFFEKQKESDRWILVFTNEIEPVELDNAPLFTDAVIKEHAIDVDRSAVEECMEDMQLMLKFPWDDKLRTVPIRYTALKSLCDRAGISGMSIMTYDDKPEIPARSQRDFRAVKSCDRAGISGMSIMTYDDKPYHSPLSPKERAETLKMFLGHFTSKALILVRDDKVSAVMSGDERDYTVMPVADLLRILLEEMQEKFSSSEFAGCNTSHEMTQATFYMNDALMEEELVNSVNSSGTQVDVDGAKFVLRMVTSDIGRNSATLVPELICGNTRMRIGEPLKLRHKGCHVEDFREQCRMIYSMFEDSSALMKKLAGVTVTNPQKVLDDIATRADLPIRSTKRAQELMSEECGGTCTGFEIYYYIFWIIEDHAFYMEQEKGKPLGLQQLFDMQEKASRQLKFFAMQNLPNNA